jgi:DNA transposition AAA+ family ATPase
MSQQTETQKVVYDVATLEQVSAGYPADMRENVVWLGRFIDRECGRNLSVLEARMKDLGFETTGGTISKILRGRWNKDAKGRATASPIMSQSSFAAMCDKLRSVSLQSAMAGSIPFVKTSTFDRIERYIEIRREKDRICKFGLIIGPTGAQKTASFKQYALENNHGQCIWMEAGETPSLSQFITDLAASYGASRHIHLTHKKLKIYECVDAGRTIIVDNIQRLYREGDMLEQQPLFNFLQKLQDEKGCTVIMSATPEFKGKFTAGLAKGYFEQFEGRCGGAGEFLVLPEFAPREDVLAIAEAYGLEGAKRHVKYLEEISRRRGRIRILFNALQTAKQIADLDSEKLAIEHVYAALGEEQGETAPSN